MNTVAAKIPSVFHRNVDTEGKKKKGERESFSTLRRETQDPHLHPPPDYIPQPLLPSHSRRPSPRTPAQVPHPPKIPPLLTPPPLHKPRPKYLTPRKYPIPPPFPSPSPFTQTPAQVPFPQQIPPLLAPPPLPKPGPNTSPPENTRTPSHSPSTPPPQKKIYIYIYNRN